MRSRLRRSLPFLFVMTALVQELALSQDQCLVCHDAIGDKNAALFKRDVHFLKGLTCADCHGGNAAKEEMEEGMNSKAGFIGVVKGDSISATCARCHSNAAVMVRRYKSTLPLDQMEALKSSVHGELSISGKEQIAQCTSCHGAHGIVPKTNRLSSVHPLNLPATCSNCHSKAAYMRGYNPGLPIDQLEKYRTSVHGMRNAGGDTKVAECASCHGSHDILPAKDVRSRVYATNIPGTCASCHADPEHMKGYNIPSDQFEKYSKSVHGKALLEKRDVGAPSCNDCHGNHGAVPPGVQSISQVCGTCHALNASLFSSSPHKKAFDKRKLPECETCHGNHEIYAAKDELVGVTGDAVCAWCHSEKKLKRGYEVAKAMRQQIDSLLGSENRAMALINEAEQKGMEVSEAKFKLRAVRQARLESRTMVHSFNEGQFHEIIDKGLGISSHASVEAAQAIDEFYFRRWGMGISTFIISVLAASLYLTIRRIERRQAEESTKSRQGS